ncbi:MAG: hypothetical protein FJX77_07780, partial [Armatimonadetes bacterium]|nr:hypothetical protein [Armatimonadota bacterium]
MRRDDLAFQFRRPFHNPTTLGRFRLLLLRAEADGSLLTGVIEERHPRTGKRYLQEYSLLRPYQMAPEQLLEGGLGTLPLAVVSAVAEEELPQVVARMRTRVAAELGPVRQQKFWALTALLLGLRMSAEKAAELLQGVTMLQESSVFQAIHALGEAKGRAEG